MSSNNPLCPKTPTPPESTGLPSVDQRSLEQDKPCEDTTSKAGSPRGDATVGDGLPSNVNTQTRNDTGVNPENPHSCTQAEGSTDPNDDSRNPITGLGLNGDGVGGWKPKKQKQREGNPVTGEGYTGPVNVPGVHPAINKNRVPPGGFSSGLW